MIKHSIVKAIYIDDIYCDICGEKMENNIQLLTYPPQFEYICPKCGNTEISKTKYPNITLETEDE